MTAPSFRTVLPLLGVLSWALSVGSVAHGQATPEEKLAERQLAAIKRQLSYKGEKETTWYVLQLEEVTTGVRSIRSSVRLRKVQGQDAAAREVYDFLKEFSPGRKIYYVDRFRDGPAAETKVDEHMARLRVSGLLKGYRFSEP